MRTTLVLDDDLLAEAQRLTGVKEKTLLVREAAEVRELVERHELFGADIGYVDAQLLAATMLSTDATLWTRDRRLHPPAQRLGLAYAPETH